MIRWKGYGPEFDQWYNVKDLENAMELVEEYEHGMAAIYEDPDSGVSAEQPLQARTIELTRWCSSSAANPLPRHPLQRFVDRVFD